MTLMTYDGSCDRSENFIVFATSHSYFDEFRFSNARDTMNVEDSDDKDKNKTDH